MMTGVNKEIAPKRPGPHASDSSLLFFTPSYRNDIDRLVLLRRSMRKFYRGSAQHVVAVPESDLALFRTALRDDDCTLVSQQSLVDRRFFPTALYSLIDRYAHGQAWRFAKHAGKGGWIIQQIAKLNAKSLKERGPILVLDSDLFFFRSFDDADLLADRGRVLVRITPTTESGRHRKHIAGARKLLRLPEGSTEHHYMSCPAILQAEWLHELARHLEQLHDKPWQDVLLAEDTMSEYSIYGVFVEETLKPSDLVIHDRSFNHMLWDTPSYARFFADPQSVLTEDPSKVCVVVQSALKVPADEYAQALEKILGNQ